MKLNTIEGTLIYLAPELLKNLGKKIDFDGTVDIYSGIIAFYIKYMKFIEKDFDITEKILDEEEKFVFSNHYNSTNLVKFFFIIIKDLV
jgi:hypothetical protein